MSDEEGRALLARAMDARAYALLRSEVDELQDRLSSLETLLGRRTTSAPVEVLDSSTVEVVRPFTVVLHPEEDEFLARWLDAEVSATGATETEAVRNLKELVVDRYLQLKDLPEERLGPRPRRQKKVFSHFLRSRRQ